MIITGDDLVAFKNSRIFSASSLRWKIWDISATSLVLKSLIQQMVFILLRLSVLLNFCLKLDSLIVKLLILQLNLMCIWLPQEGEKPLSNPSLYRRLIGSLVYLTVIRLDISYDVHQVSQYLSTPWSTHYATILRILRYLKITLFHGLFYFAQSPLILHAFFDADWVGDPTDCKSTIGYCFLLGSSLISWWSKKQTLVVCSNTEA